MAILVLNCGSSSIKFSVLDQGVGGARCSGAIGGIGEPRGSLRVNANGATRSEDLTVPDHATALDLVLRDVGPKDVTAVGHRVAHGGERFSAPVLLDEEVLRDLAGLDLLAPLHNPAGRLGMDYCLQQFPGVPQVAVFDTAFHADLPERAWRYAVPEHWHREHGVRRYGFHGLSHQYVCAQSARLLGRPGGELNIISLHLGNGASAAAIRGGRCVDTSMGMTPLEGLVMGTRGGDIDPGALLHLLRQGISVAELDRELNQRSGLRGLCGDNDMRRVRQLAAQGDERAGFALDLYAYRLRKYIGAFFAVLGRVDAVCFTGGIGEHDAALRAAVIDELPGLGLRLNPQLNCEPGDQVRPVHAADSGVAVLVVPTDEESQIAREVHYLLLQQGID